MINKIKFQYIKTSTDKIKNKFRHKALTSDLFYDQCMLN